MYRRLVPDLVSGQKLSMLPPQAMVVEAVRLMAARRIGAVLVEEAGRLVGIFTERDLVIRVVAADRDPATTALAAVMTADPDVGAPDDTPVGALERMSRGGYRHLPVVEGGHVIGIVSIRDLFRVVTAELKDDLRQRDQLLFDTGYGGGH